MEADTDTSQDEGQTPVYLLQEESIWDNEDDDDTEYADPEDEDEIDDFEDTSESMGKALHMRSDVVLVMSSQTLRHRRRLRERRRDIQRSHRGTRGNRRRRHSDQNHRGRANGLDPRAAGRARSVLRAPAEMERNMLIFTAVTQRQLLQLLSGAGLRNLFASHGGGDINLELTAGDADEDDDSGRYSFLGGGSRRTRRRRNTPYKWPPVPNPEGQKLIDEGIFGTNEVEKDTLIRKRKKNIAYRTMMRELGLNSPGGERGKARILRHDMIPSARPDLLINNHQARGYCGQFSDDGNFFFTCSQDFKVRMYDTSNPYRWKYYKKAAYYGGQWTITDASLSPDNRYLAYSSIRPQACLAATDPADTSEPQSLDFSNLTGQPRTRRYTEWGIWSLRFSGDGREIVAGTSDRSLYVYDIEAGRSILRIAGHMDDVNAVCYGDKSSPHILFSGSDDTTIKVWDRRSLGDQRAAGAFLGHTEGLTYVDSKGDGRFVISNAKDQTMKLWDLRKMVPQEQVDDIDPMAWSSGWDYRYPPYNEADRQAHPHDCSLVTFRGHKVVNTLIRCHFSPAGSTDNRYVYSGSTDGCVWIWNMDGSVRSKLEVSKNTGLAASREEAYAGFGARGRSGHAILRDVSWHPNAPILASKCASVSQKSLSLTMAATSWDGGYHGCGMTSVHSWNDDANDDEGDPPMGFRVNSEMKPEARYTTNQQSRAQARVEMDEDTSDGEYSSL